MGEPNLRVDIQKLLSFGNDLIEVVNNKKDGESLTQSVESEKTLRAATQGDSQEVQASLEEYQKKINECKESIDKTRREEVADAEMEHLQNELEEKLQRESFLCQELSTAVHEELDDLDCQRISIDKQKELVKKREKDLLRAQRVKRHLAKPFHHRKRKMMYSCSGSCAGSVVNWDSWEVKIQILDLKPF